MNDLDTNSLRWTKNWLVHTPLAKDNLIERQSSPAIDSKSQRLLRFSDAPPRRHSTSSQGYLLNNDMPNQLTEQKRLSVYNWNLGHRRGNEGAIEKQIAVKWAHITLEEAIEYMDREFLATRFHVTHDGICAILVSKETFFPDTKVTSIYLHDLRYSQPDKVN